MIELNDLLAFMREQSASDLHLVIGQKPTFRLHGEFLRRDSDPLLTADDMERMVLSQMNETQRGPFEHAHHDTDVTVREGNRRFRMHVFRDRSGVAAAIRIIPNRVPSLDELSLGAGNEPDLTKFTRITRGLIVITGPTGSGKSTLCAAMLEEINRTRAERIITLEDPIEYEFSDNKSLISQRSVGEDIVGYPEGLKAAMYMDPDVIMVDRLRDLETMLLTLSAAETGHLIFVTLNVHTVSTAILRIIDSFAEGQRPVVRDMLSRNLQAVIAQSLVPRTGNVGRAAVHEILIATPRVRQMIADGQTDMTLAIEAERSAGMQTMDDALINLYNRGAISRETTQSHMTDKFRLPTLEAK